MEVMGWRVPEAVVPLFRMVKLHPQLWFFGGTCAVCSFLQWRANVANRSVLLASQQRIVTQHAETLEECKELLRTLDMEWNKDMRRRDDMMRKMVVQNVEQARSVDRLDAALKLCINTPPSSIQLTSVVTQPKEPALVAEFVSSVVPVPSPLQTLPPAPPSEQEALPAEGPSAAKEEA